MSFRIVVEGVDLDLTPDIERKFYITKQSHDLRDLNTREATFSKIVDVPLTERNINAIGDWIPKYAAYNTAAYVFKNCDVLIDEISVVQDAKLYVVSTDTIRNMASIGIVGGDQSLFSQLSDEPIADLRWNEFNINWTLANVANEVNNTTGIVVPQSIWHDNFSFREFTAAHVNLSVFNVNDIDIFKSGFFIYVRSILDKILDNTEGLIFDLSAFDATNLDQLAISCPVTKFVNPETENGGVALVTESSNEIAVNSTGTLPFNTVEADVQGLWSVPNNEFTVNGTGVVEIDLKLDVSMQPNNPNFTDNVLKITVNSNPIRTFPLQSRRFIVEHNFIDEVLITTLQSGDKIKVEFETGPNESESGLIAFEYEGSFGLLVGTVGDYIKVENWLPNISQKDFFRDILKYFHMMLYESNGTVSFKRWEDMTLSDVVPYDIKINMDKGIGAQVAIQNLAQTNKFKYKDNPNVEANIFNIYFNVPNESLKLETVLIESLYSGSDPSETPVTGSLVDGRVSVPAFTFEYAEETKNNMTITGGGLNFSTGSNSGLKKGDIVFVAGQRGEVANMFDALTGAFTNSIGVTGTNQNWEFNRYSSQAFLTHLCLIEENPDAMNLVDGNNVQTITATNSRVAKFPLELNWEFLLNLNYDNYVKSVKKPYFLRVDVVLTPAEFLSLSPLVPIYIERLRGLFYLNKVKQFKSGALTTLELLLIKYF